MRSTSRNKGTSSTTLVLDRPSEYDQAGGHRLRRFYFRALVGVLGPLIVCGYFIAVWRIYLAPIDPYSPLAFGLPGATWIFYSWFVAGVIGLNLSLYGLVGVEAAMLMEPAWDVGDAMRLMMHADNTWSGPGGWLKTIKWMVQLQRGGGHGKLPSLLWFILALPSMLVFIAWPLSGLTMEVTQGYLHGSRNDSGAIRNSGDAFGGSKVTWQNALGANIPGAGIVYTPEGIDRSQHAFLNKLPTVFPKDEGVTRVFLAAQAQNPIEGNNWGLLLQYNCSVVDKVEDLSILRYRNSSAEQRSLLGSYGQTSYTVKEDSMQITVQNETDTKWVDNLYAVAELGYEIWPDKTAMARMTADDPDSMFTKQNSCYFNEAENITGEYPGIDQEQVFEVLLWQTLINTSRSDPANAPQYNFSIDHNITELFGAYNWRDFFMDQLSTPKNQTNEFPLRPMTAIGVQCRASSNVGTADIDGVRSTYSNFVRTDTPILIQTNRCAHRFMAQTPSWMMPGFGEEWLSSFFTSSAAPPPFYATYVTDESDIDASTGYMVQLNYLQAEQLRRSMLHAYASYAVQLMYNGGQGFTSRDGSHNSFLNPNITEFVSGTVLKLGVMPATIPVTLFCIWALMGSVLGILYGFRRRWSDILDGYTMFRLGLDLPADAKRRLAQWSNTVEVEECLGLNDMPGFVGDSSPEMWLGHIGLVSGSVAHKTKMYE